MDMRQSLERLDDGSRAASRSTRPTHDRLTTTARSPKAAHGGLRRRDDQPALTSRLSRFFADPGNVQPLVPETFANLPSRAGSVGGDALLQRRCPRRER
jgi:hypothetical protein